MTAAIGFTITNLITKLINEGRREEAQAVILLRDDARAGHATRRDVLSEFAARIPLEVRLYDDDRKDLVRWVETQIRYEDDRLDELEGDRAEE